MGKGNYRAPGDHYGRPNEMIYVDNMEWGDEDEFVIREDDVYDTIKHSLPKSFRVNERWVSDGAHSYFVYMESDTCEVVVEQYDTYHVVAFVGKEKVSGGWYTNWRRTAKKAFKRLHDDGFDLMVRTGPWTSSVWTPDGYVSYGRKYNAFAKMEMIHEYIP